MRKLIHSMLIVGHFTTLISPAWAGTKAKKFEAKKTPPDFRGCINTYEAFRANVGTLEHFTSESVDLLNQGKNPFAEGMAKTNDQKVNLNSDELSGKTLSSLSKNAEHKFKEAEEMSMTALEQFASAAGGNNTLSEYLNDCAVMLQARLKDLESQAMDVSAVKREVIILSSTIGATEIATTAWQWYNENKCAGSHNVENLKQGVLSTDSGLTSVDKLSVAGDKVTVSGIYNGAPFKEGFSGAVTRTYDIGEVSLAQQGPPTIGAGTNFSGQSTAVAAGLGGAVGALVGGKGASKKLKAAAIGAAGSAALVNIGNIGSVLKNGATIAGSAAKSMAGSVACSDYAVLSRMLIQAGAVYKTFTGKMDDFIDKAKKLSEDHRKVKKAKEALDVLQLVYSTITVKSAAQYIETKMNAEAVTACMAGPQAAACSGLISAFETQKWAAGASVAALIPTTISAINKLEDAEDYIQADAKEAHTFLDDYINTVPQLVDNGVVLSMHSPEAEKAIAASEIGGHVSKHNHEHAIDQVQSGDHAQASSLGLSDQSGSQQGATAAAASSRGLASGTGLVAENGLSIKDLEKGRLNLFERNKRITPKK